MENKYPLATSSWDEKEISAINSVVATGVFSMGKEVQKYEEQFAAFFKSPFL